MIDKREQDKLKDEAVNKVNELSDALDDARSEADDMEDSLKKVRDILNGANEENWQDCMQTAISEIDGIV